MLLEFGLPVRIVMDDDAAGFGPGGDAVDAGNCAEGLAVYLKNFRVRPSVRHLHTDAPADFVLDARMVLPMDTRLHRRGGRSRRGRPRPVDFIYRHKSTAATLL